MTRTCARVFWSLWLLCFALQAQAVQGLDLTGQWKASFGGTVEITQTGSKITLQNEAGLKFVGDLTGRSLKVAHKYASRAEVPGSLPDKVKDQLVGTEITVRGQVSADGQTIEGKLVQYRVKYNLTTFAITSKTEVENDISFTRVASDADSEVVQFHEKTVTVKGSNLPASVRDAKFSDPKVELVKVESSSATEAKLVVYAGEGCSGKPVDVTLEGADGSSATVKSAIKVKLVRATMLLIERFNPAPDDTDFTQFDFDVSVRVMTVRRPEDIDDQSRFEPLKGCKVSVEPRDSSLACIVTGATTLDGLGGTSADSSYTTDETGRIYLKVRARLKDSPVDLDIRFGDERVSTETFLSVSWSSFFQDQPKPPEGNTFDRTFKDGQAGMQEVKKEKVCERLLNGAKDSVTGVIFTALTFTGVEADPRYQIIKFAVHVAKAGLGDTSQVSQMGFDQDEASKIVRSANELKRKLGGLLAGDEDELCRAIYGGLLLGGVKGTVSAGFDQTLGVIAHLGDALKKYVDYAKEHKIEALKEAGKTYLTVMLWVNPLTGPTMAARKGADNAIRGFKWVFGLGEKVAEKIDPEAFQSFLAHAYHDWFEVTGDSVQLKATVQRLLLKGVLAELEGANYIFDAGDSILPELGKDLSSYAVQLHIDPTTTSPQFKLFTGGYFVGLGTSYVVTFVGIEILTFLASDGVASFVKGSVALQRLQKVWHAINLLDFVVSMQELFGSSEAPLQLALRGEPFFPDARRNARFVLYIFYVAGEFLEKPERLKAILSPFFDPALRAKAAKVISELAAEVKTIGMKATVAGEIARDAGNGLVKLCTRLDTLAEGRISRWVEDIEPIFVKFAQNAGENAAEVSEMSRAIARRVISRTGEEGERLLATFSEMGANNREFLSSLVNEARTYTYETAAAARRQLKKIPAGLKPLDENEFRLETVLDVIDTVKREGQPLKKGALAHFGIDEFAAYVDNLRQSLGRRLLGTDPDMPKYARALDAQIKVMAKEMKQVRKPTAKNIEDLRDAFNGGLKERLIALWEKEHKLTWPVYDQTIFRIPQGDKTILCVLDKGQLINVNTQKAVAAPAGLIKKITDGGLDLSTAEKRAEWIFRFGEDCKSYKSLNGFQAAKLDAHHIVELELGGRNEWWNLIPVRSPEQHQGGVHGSGSFLKDLLDMGSEGDIIRLFAGG